VTNPIQETEPVIQDWVSQINQPETILDEQIKNCYPNFFDGVAETEKISVSRKVFEWNRPEGPKHKINNSGVEQSSFRSWRRDFESHRHEPELALLGAVFIDD